jgi:hypothetical protein
MKTKSFNVFTSVLTVCLFLFLAFGSEDTPTSESTEITVSDEDESYLEEESYSEDQDDEGFTVDPEQLAMLEAYLGAGEWTCTDVQSGTAPFMRGATFGFANGRMFVTSGPTSVENSYSITGIVPNYPEGSILSAMITINQNQDMLSAITEDLMVLSWGGDQAKLILQR